MRPANWVDPEDLPFACNVRNSPCVQGAKEARRVKPFKSGEDCFQAVIKGEWNRRSKQSAPLNLLNIVWKQSNGTACSSYCGVHTMESRHFYKWPIFIQIELPSLWSAAPTVRVRLEALLVCLKDRSNRQSAGRSAVRMPLGNRFLLMKSTSAISRY